MGRPKRVRYDTFHLYDKLHTVKTNMFSGVELTTLFPIKETPLFYQSIEVWAYCASKFRAKKQGFKLNVDIPLLTDPAAVAFLNEHAWHDWVAIERKDKETDVIETVALLDKLFPGINWNKHTFYNDFYMDRGAENSVASLLGRALEKDLFKEGGEEQFKTYCVTNFVNRILNDL